MEGEIVNTSSSTEVNEEENVNEAETVEDKVEEVEEPRVDMMFDSLKEAHDYYKRYSMQMGFDVATKTSTKDDDGQVKYVTFACNRFGKPKCTSKINLRPFVVIKTGCKAKFSVSLWPNGKWRTNSLVIDHNHVLSPGNSRHCRRNRSRKPHTKRKLELNDKAGIKMNKNCSSSIVEAKGDENLSFLENDCKNYTEKGRRSRLGDGDTNAVQNYFRKKQTSDSEFFYMIDLDEEGRLKNVLWADARSRAAFEEFGDVVMFDIMCLTNKYDMTFAPFVGINHHGQSIMLGCGLISSEDTKTFTWLFQSWLACMSGHAPAAIITDQNIAMQNAIKEIFPNARYRWCLWHIMKKLPEKLKGYKEYEGIKFAFQNAVCGSFTPLEFEESWNLMIEKFKLDSNEWLTELYKERHLWVPALVKDSFWAGMSITGRGESMDAFFDGQVNSKTTLKQLVEQYEIALRNKVEKENLEDFYSFTSLVPCITHYDMEKQLQETYTSAKFREFQHELTGKLYCVPYLVKEGGAILEYEVSEDVKVGETLKRVNFTVFFKKMESEEECEVQCSCRSFEFRGILCKHAISVFIEKGIYSVPVKYILHRWRRDIRRRYTMIKISYGDWGAKPEGLRFDRMCNAFRNVAYLAIHSEDKCNVVMDWIHYLEGEVLRNEGTCESSQPTKWSNFDRSAGGEARDMTKENQNVFTPLAITPLAITPLAIQSMGCPFKRKLSTVDQHVEKRKEKKESKEKKITESGKFSDIEEQPLKEVGDVIPTQEGIVVTDSQSTQNIHVYRSDGDHPSMLQFHNVPLRMGMPHLLKGMPGFHYGPPSFAPQLYFGQGSQGYFAADPKYVPGNLVFNRSNTQRDLYSKSKDK